MLQFEHLKSFNSIEGYWSSSDCVDIATSIIETTGATSMLEIGFNIGYSASIWIEAGIKELIVIDINRHKDTYPAILATAKNYRDSCNIKWWLGDSKSTDAYELDVPKIDMCFIDGEHSYEGALNDSWLGIHYRAKWLIYDDVIENHVNGIDKAINSLVTKQAIQVVNKYKMTWTEEGSVYLCKVLI